MKTFTYKLLTKTLSRYFRTPQYLILYVTNNCWMRCRHCFYNEQFRKANKIENDTLSFGEIEKIAGSKFFGQWRLEVWVDNRHVATKAFSVGN